MWNLPAANPKSPNSRRSNFRNSSSPIPNSGGPIKWERPLSTPQNSGSKSASRFLTVHPNVGAVVDSEKIQPDILFNAGGRRKLGPIPPGTAERAAFGHVLIGEKLFVRMTHPGKGIEIGSVVGIGIRFVGNQRADNGGWNVSLVPRGGVETRQRNLIACDFCFT